MKKLQIGIGKINKQTRFLYKIQETLDELGQGTEDLDTNSNGFADVVKANIEKRVSKIKPNGEEVQAAKNILSGKGADKMQGAEGLKLYEGGAEQEVNKEKQSENDEAKVSKFEKKKPGFFRKVADRVGSYAALGAKYGAIIGAIITGGIGTIAGLVLIASSGPAAIPLALGFVALYTVLGAIGGAFKGMLIGLIVGLVKGNENKKKAKKE